MKQFKITILFTMLMSMVSINGFADYDAEIDGIFYRFTNKEAIVTCQYTTRENRNAYWGNIVIPESVTYHDKIFPVTEIDKSAFCYCTDMITVVIGNNVKIIGDKAFKECGSLTSITMGNNVTKIGSSAFKECSDLSSITIPNSVTAIGDYTFSRCIGLTSVTIPNSVTSIGMGAFYDCSSLTSVTIPNSVTTIGVDAFYRCSGLTSVHISDLEAWCGIEFRSNPLSNAHHLYLNGEEIKNLVIPNSVTTIGNTAFSGCTGLTSVTIGNSVTSIGDYAFSGCSGLTSVTIPNSVTSIGSDAFYGTAWFDNQPDGLVYAGKVAYEYKGKMPDNTHITLKEGTTGIVGSAFSHCTGLTSVTIPNSVTSIGDHAFGYCKKLTDVTCLAKNLSHSLSSNKGLYTYDTAFYGSDIEYATLHVPAAAIEAYKATAPWSGFKSIVSIGEDDPSLTPDGETNGACGESVNYYYDKNTKTLSISGKGELYDYDNGSNKAPWSAYADEIQKIEIESGIISVGYCAFYKCSSLTSLSVPATLKYIGSSAFEDCTSLTSLSLNEGLLIIEGSAFKNCKGITDVYCYAKSVPKTNKTAFDGTPIESATLHVPANSVDAYKASRPWSNFKKIVAIGSAGLEGISAYSIGGAIIQSNDLINYGSKLYWSFSNNSNVNVTLVSMQLIDGVTKVEGNLMSVNKLVEAGASVSYTTTIGALGIHVPVTCRFRYNYDGSEYYTDAVYTGAFGPDPTTDSGKCGESVKYSYNKITKTLSISGNGEIYDYDNGSNKAPWSAYADEIKKIKIESGIISVGYFAFYKCSSLTSLSVPATLKYIGSSAFEDCTSLTSLSLKDGLLIIEGSAFKNCKAIADVYCYAESVPKTNKTAFDGTPIESATLHVSASAVEAYSASQPWSGFKAIVALTDEDIMGEDNMDEEATGIEGVKRSEDGNGEYYDLTGRKVSHPQKGIFIKNGKKVIVK